MKQDDIEKLLLSINPNIKKYLNKKINLLNDGIIDSFDIMRLLVEIEKKKKKKINYSKVSRNTFANFGTIKKFVDKL